MSRKLIETNMNRHIGKPKGWLANLAWGSIFQWLWDNADEIIEFLQQIRDLKRRNNDTKGNS